MNALEPASARPGLVARVARWCIEHRRRTVAAWLVLLIAALGSASVIGTRQADDFTLGGTDSQRAQDVLERDFPSQSGDVDQIVFAVPRGRITDPAIRAQIAPVLDRIARLPHVSAVTSPYAAGGRAISSGPLKPWPKPSASRS